MAKRLFKKYFFFQINMLAMIFLLVSFGYSKSLYFPRYAVLFEKLESLEKQKSYEKSIRLIPKIYETQVPVDSFYAVLDKKKRQLVKKILEKRYFILANERYLVDDLEKFYRFLNEGFIEKLHYRLEVKDNFPSIRLYYLFLSFAQGDNKAFSYKPLCNSLPYVDLSKALEENDPWLVSAALFVARRDDNRPISMEQVLQRWQQRPDFWDANCTEQALLYLAKFPEMDTKRVENEDIKDYLARLIPIDKDIKACYVKPFIFDVNQLTLSNISMKKELIIKKYDNGQTKYECNISNCPFGYFNTKKTIVVLRPGVYSFKFLRQKQYGKSNKFVCDKGFFIRIYISFWGVR